MYRGKPIYSMLYGVQALNSQDIWVTEGVPYHGDGINWEINHLWDMGILERTDGSLYKIWGTRNNLYFVGNRGTAVHYDGTTWKRIETGTRVVINDVWGAKNPRSGEEVVLCAVSDNTIVAERRILRLTRDGVIDSIPWRPDKNVSSVWFERPEKIFTAGEGAYVRNSSGGWDSQTGFMPYYYSYRVRGQAENDVFVVMDNGCISHFNGAHWTTLVDPSAYTYTSCAYVGDLFIAVGFTAQTNAVITMLRRVRR